MRRYLRMPRLTRRQVITLIALFPFAYGAAIALVWGGWIAVQVLAR